jgi:hypothetical protein
LTPLPGSRATGPTRELELLQVQAARRPRRQSQPSNWATAGRPGRRPGRLYYWGRGTACACRGSCRASQIAANFSHLEPTRPPGGVPCPSRAFSTS